MQLLKAVLRHSTTPLKAADARELASSITAIANEKLKAEKHANGSKKKQGNESPEPSYLCKINAACTAKVYSKMSSMTQTLCARQLVIESLDGRHVYSTDSLVEF